MDYEKYFGENLEVDRSFRISKKHIVALLVPFLLVLGAMYVISSEVVSVTFISGTEYQQGEAGSVIVRTLNGFGIPVTANWCNITIAYPDGTIWINNQAMTNTGATTGTWRYDFTTPFDKIGNYEEYVRCEIPLSGGRTRIVGAGKSFHVSQTLTLLNETASAQVVILS